MISVSTIMRIFRGVKFRRIETVAALKDNVNTSARHMTIVFSTRLVTARVLQIPRTCLNTGLLCHNPSIINFLFSDSASFILNPYPLSRNLDCAMASKPY